MFDVGDKVRVVDTPFGRQHYGYLDAVGEIRRIDRYTLQPYGVLFADQTLRWFSESELEPVEERE